MKKIFITILFFQIICLTNISNATDIKLNDNQNTILQTNQSSYNINAKTNDNEHNLNEVYNQQTINNQINQLQIDNIISETEKLSNKNIDLKEVFNRSIKGKNSVNLIINMIGITLGEQIREILDSMILIIVIIVIYSILKNISQSLGNSQVGRIGHFIQIIILLTVILKVYTNVIQIVKQTIELISSFAYSLLPVFVSISIASGNITSSTGIQSIILFSMNLITGFINQILIPILMISTVIGIISNISDNIQMTRLAKYMKSTIIWILCIMLTIFTCILSMESSLGQGVDNVTSKTTKTAVSTFVPIVGKILGDTVDSVLSCTGVLKNAIGTIGIVGAISIAISPLLKIGVICIFFYLISGIAEMIADEKIVYVVEQMGDSCKVLFACLTSIVVMLIIGFTITMKIIPT